MSDVILETTSQTKKSRGLTALSAIQLLAEVALNICPRAVSTLDIAATPLIPNGLPCD